MTNRSKTTERKTERVRHMYKRVKHAMKAGNNLSLVKSLTYKNTGVLFNDEKRKIYR